MKLGGHTLRALKGAEQALLPKTLNQAAGRLPQRHSSTAQHAALQLLQTAWHSLQPSRTLHDDTRTQCLCSRFGRRGSGSKRFQQLAKKYGPMLTEPR